ncbi:hypothetical protein [Parerythrobacter jejuensis]|uniref:Uncharacterized protein n=1 Tax=Parerythrobacter jejuensis TaxID=795812 RepID=A0A845ANT6_9SPHN|nr:hypothetical protein [Parerythrobacter jejuensis]MXP31274.1 hypothetical protein [Parerythrobacter jejuensis]MXP34034.1 hypothetical protein [Parerythrobacter jejuensis]
MARSVTLLDRRMVAAIQVVDPLDRPVDVPIGFEAQGARWIDKGSGLFVLLEWDRDRALSRNWENQVSTFATGSQSLNLILTPVGNRLMPRKASIALPRQPDPAQRDNPDSLFQPARVMLSAASGFRAEGNACAVTVTLSRQSDGHAIEHAVIRLRDAANGPIRTTGITNRHGEAMLVLAGLPLAAAGNNASASPTHAMVVEALVDPANARFNAEPPANTAPPIDPDAVIAATAPAGIVQTSVDLQTGRTASAKLAWSAP